MPEIIDKTLLAARRALGMEETPPEPVADAHDAVMVPGTAKGISSIAPAIANYPHEDPVPAHTDWTPGRGPVQKLVSGVQRLGDKYLGTGKPVDRVVPAEPTGSLEGYLSPIKGSSDLYQDSRGASWRLMDESETLRQDGKIYQKVKE